MIFLNDNNDKIEIVVNIVMDYSGKCRYRISDILITPYGKRKTISLSSKIKCTNEYRITGRDTLSEYIRSEYLKYCTEDQIWEAVREEYEKMAPMRDKIEYTL